MNSTFLDTRQFWFIGELFNLGGHRASRGVWDRGVRIRWFIFIRLQGRHVTMAQDLGARLKPKTWLANGWSSAKPTVSLGPIYFDEIPFHGFSW